MREQRSQRKCFLYIAKKYDRYVLDFKEVKQMKNNDGEK